MTYDRIYKKFHERLVNEYAGMRGGYMTEFQINYNQNSSRRDDRLVEMSLSIEAEDNYANELAKTRDTQASCLNMFFTQKFNKFRIKVVWKAWRYYFGVYKRKARLAAFTRNSLHRKKMNRLFGSWRGVTDQSFKVRMEIEKKTFRTELET